MTATERKVLADIVSGLQTWTHNAKISAYEESKGRRAFFRLDSCLEAIGEYTAKAERMVKP